MMPFASDQIETRAKALFHAEKAKGKWPSDMVWENDKATQGLKKGEGIPIPRVLPEAYKAAYRDQASSNAEGPH